MGVGASGEGPHREEDGREHDTDWLREELERIAERLRWQASRMLSGGAHRSRETDDLVNEVAVRVMRRPNPKARHRLHLEIICSREFLDVFAEWVRYRVALKRGGPGRQSPVASEPPETLWRRVTLTAESAGEIHLDLASFLDLREALARLEVSHPQRARVVQLTYFGGLPVKEIAELTGKAVAQIRGLLEKGRQQLARWLGSGEA